MVPAVLSGCSVLLTDHPGTPTISPFFEKAIEESAPNLVTSFFVDSLNMSHVYQSREVKHVAFAGTYKEALDVHFELGKNDFITSSYDLGGLNFAYIG